MRNRILNGNEPSAARAAAYDCAGVAWGGRRRLGVSAALAVLLAMAAAGTAAGQAVLPHTVSARPAFAAAAMVPGPAAAPSSAVAASAAMATSGGQAFAIEATGAVVGSLLGFSTIYLSRDRCEVEDLGCNLETVFGGIVLGTAGATAGAWLAGRAGDTDPSLAGAAIGSVVGVGAGIGLWHLFTEELDIVNEPFAAALTYSFAQGVATALGSRLVRRLRR